MQQGVPNPHPQSEIYLPKLSSQDGSEYDTYKQRATFYNFTAGTINALVGTVEKRPPKINGVPKRLESRLDAITLSRQHLRDGEADPGRATGDEG